MGALMSSCRIDHITVTSPSLEAGRAFVHECLGVPLQRGGRHPRMGTHNLLLRLGETMFLEVIAVDPEAVRPDRPRWFALDALPQDARPRLGCWVARTASIEAAMGAASEPLGSIEPMSRGALEWLISVPGDGSLPLGGVAPALIEWHVSPHPAAGMEDAGCALVALELLHPEPQRVSALLRSIGLAEPGVSVSVAEAAAPALVACIRTPSGLRTIGAAPSANPSA
jgi:hypothetical protein